MFSIVVRRPGEAGAAFLDALRGVAAVLVVLGHARLMLMANAKDVPNLGVGAKVFYLLSNQGSAAVMVFFVLSGYLVGASVIRSMLDGTWSTREYFSARFARIYGVLVPALIVGALFDMVGTRSLGHSVVYSTPRYGWMLPDSVSGNLSLRVFLGNLASLQTIVVDTLGSNHPLWSLANEVWYYIVSPFFAVVLHPRRSVATKAMLVLVGCALLALLPFPITLLFLVWVMGAVLSVLPHVRLPRYARTVVTGVFLAWLVAVSAKMVASDLVTGLLSALLIYTWIASPSVAPPEWFTRIASRLSAVSYSYYLFHTPFIVLLAALIVGNGPKFGPDLEGQLLVIGLLSLSFIYAWGMWWLFERHTPALRRLLASRLLRRAPTPAPVATK